MVNFSFKPADCKREDFQRYLNEGLPNEPIDLVWGQNPIIGCPEDEPIGLLFEARFSPATERTDAGGITVPWHRISRFGHRNSVYMGVFEKGGYQNAVDSLNQHMGANTPTIPVKWA